MKCARIDHLHAVAKERPAGYLEACMKAGKPSPDGQWVFFDDEAHAAIRRQFNRLAGRAATPWKPSPGAQGPPRKLSGDPRPTAAGLGDLVHSIAVPIGRAIGWPCLKGDGTTELKPGSPCDRARRTLNKIKL
jgi:hypothetical protein